MIKIDTNTHELISVARGSRERAYAPYSGFKVGAALRADSGEIVGGCNIENISYGLTICAERVALGSALEKGLVAFRALAIVSDSKEPVVPCGACRQVLAEFCQDLKIFSVTLDDQTAEFELSELLPRPRQGIRG